MKETDVLVIGAGPAGTIAAIRAATLRAKTILITSGAFGGMAANDGPIPVRTLAHAARLAREARQLSRYGFITGEVSLDYERLVQRARDVVAEAATRSTFRSDIDRAGVELIEQTGNVRFIDPHAVMTPGGEVFRARKIIICTGGVSRPIAAPGADLVVTPAAAFSLTAIPRSMIVIGAGATGAQVASIFNAFGTNIHLFESGDRIIKTEDADVSAEVARAFREDGISIYEGFGQIERFERTPDGVTMTYGGGKTVTAEVAVAAAGWIADTKVLSLQTAGVALSPRGFIAVNEHLQTSSKHIFAAGDVTGRWMLVPQSAYDGYVAGTNAASREMILADEDVNPIGSFTDPEYARVGCTEAQARASGDVLVSTARYDETTRPIIDDRTRGFCKVIVDRDSRAILGTHVVGERAVEVAQMAAIAIEAKMTVDELVRVPLSFPTYANVFGRAVASAVREATPAAVVSG
jgi:pyruvate/2-oxoglutarate dehydrogenase complex dihydrolipoamide dehydrogenase (E3) component